MRWAWVLLSVAACSESEGPPPCGSGSYTFRTLIPGPGEAGHEPALAQAAQRRERVWGQVNAAATGLNADVSVALEDTGTRARIMAIADDPTLDGRVEGGAPLGSPEPSAGLYSGAGVAADAFRYATLRDQGAACAEIDAARAQLLRGLAAMHIASTIGGVPGVIARGLARKDLPGTGMNVQTVPLFDAAGAPLPAEKDNGTWREDQSGLYPGWVWQDSASRDMLVGWAMGFAAAHEVLAQDPTVPEASQATLRADALAIGRSLSTVQASGYDLEIRDADGRATFHGILNEHGLEHGYLPDFDNGFYALMSLGIVAAFADTAEDPGLARYLQEELVGRRRLQTLARRDVTLVNLGPISNHSNFNMAFTAAWLALRYLKDEAAKDEVRLALRDQMYAPADIENTPQEMKQSFYDLIYAYGLGDGAAVERALETLRDFPAAPYWEEPRANCDQQEIDSGLCTLDDGTVVHLRGNVGRGDTLVAVEPIPMRVRPASNYHWRSNPYEPNGAGNGGRLLPAVDFRVAYWMGRFLRAAP